MRPTRVGVLAVWAAVAAVAGFVLAASAYSSLPPLPKYAPFTLALLAVVELGMARVVRDRVQRRPRPGARRLHPFQVARAAALAKASSPAGALLFGGYGGVFVWLLGKEATQQHADRTVSGVSAATALALVVAALLLERACRTPGGPDDEPRTGVRA